MNQAANVTSIDAIKTFRVALQAYESDARDTLMILNLEVRKAMSWIEHDRAQYWLQQVREASDAYVQARNELERRELATRPDDKQSSYEHKIIVEKTKRRWRYCEAQVEVVKKWRRTLQHEIAEFQGEIAKMSNFLDLDIPRAVAALGRIITALDKYARTAAPREATVTSENVTASDTPSAQASDGKST